LSSHGPASLGACGGCAEQVCHMDDSGGGLEETAAWNRILSHALVSYRIGATIVESTGAKQWRCAAG